MASIQQIKQQLVTFSVFCVFFPPALPPAGRKLQRLEAEVLELEAESQSLQAALEEMRLSSRRLEQLEVEKQSLEQESAGLERDQRRLEKENRRLRQQVSNGEAPPGVLPGVSCQIRSCRTYCRRWW